MWLADDRPRRWRCPKEQLSFDVSPRGTQRFPVPAECEFRYTILPAGATGLIRSDLHGLLTVPQVPIRRDRASAARLRIEHHVACPVVSVWSPSHPTPLPCRDRRVHVMWRIANCWNGQRVPANRYACWIARAVENHIPDGAETEACERFFQLAAPGRYYLHARAHRPGHGWGPLTLREVNIDCDDDE